MDPFPKANRHEGRRIGLGEGRLRCVWGNGWAYLAYFSMK